MSENIRKKTAVIVTPKEESPDEEVFPFSSTLIEDEELEEPYFSDFLDLINKSKETYLDDSLIIHSTSERISTSINKDLDDLKNDLFKSSFYIQQALNILKSKMADFLMEKTLQYIPEFRGV